MKLTSCFGLGFSPSQLQFISRSRTRRVSRLLLMSAFAPLAACTTGKTFSIAMTNPGSSATVLLVGDASPGSAAPAESATLPAEAVTSGLLGRISPSSPPQETALLQTQEPAVLTSASPTLSSGGANTVIAAVTSVGNAAAPVAVAVYAAPLTGVQVSAAPATTTTTASLITPVASTTVAATSGGASVQLTTPVVTTTAAVSPAQPIQVAVATPVSVSPAGSAGLILTSSGTAAQITTPVVAVSTSVQPAQAIQAAVTTPAGPSSPVAAVATVASSGVSAQLATPVTTVTAAAGPSQGVQAVVTSPAPTSIATATVVLSSVPANARTALVGIGGTLAAPTPGATTSGAAAVLKAATLSKLKHG